MGRGHDELIVNFVDTLPTAKKQPNDAVFQRIDATIGSETKPAVFVTGPSRLTYAHVAIPEKAWLRVSLALKPEAWSMDGDGVTFFIIVSDGKNPESVLTRDIDPHSVSADRAWHDELIDLSDYGGETIDIIFNTRSGPRGDSKDDLALWGAPRLVVR